MLDLVRPALVSVGLFTLLLGFAYPLAVTGLAQGLTPAQADGSLVRRDGKIVGSTLIGQTFTAPGYLHGRPSAAGSDGYDAAASSGSNLGPMNPDLIEREKTGAADYREATGQRVTPADAVTTSGSGLDPDVSPINAALQAPRIAAARGVRVSQIEQVIAAHTKDRTLGFIGQPRVNVLQVNLDLDARFPGPDRPR